MKAAEEVDSCLVPALGACGIFPVSTAATATALEDMQAKIVRENSPSSVSKILIVCNINHGFEVRTFVRPPSSKLLIFCCLV